MSGIDPRDFLLNTDYEQDKLVLFKQGSFTNSVTIPHNLAYAPLAFGVWSTQADFSSVNAIGETDKGTEPGYTPVLSVECLSDRNNIVLNSAGNSSSMKLYYRVYAFQPSELNKAAPATSLSAEDFILNTDYNYSKLKAKGEFTQANQQYEHALGYIPQVMAWYLATSGGRQVIRPFMDSNEATGAKLTVTQRSIILGAMPARATKVYWRVYYDEAE